MPASIVELTLPIAALRALAVYELPMDHPAVKALTDAILEPENTMSRPQAESHRRWVTKALNAMIPAELYDRRAKGVYAVLFWLGDLLLQEKLVLYEDSAADIAITKLRDALGDQPEGVLESARKHGRKIGERAKALGYYCY